MYLDESMTAVHNRLNPKIWNEDNTLRSEVKKKLMEIVSYFAETVDIDLNIVDVIIVGSNASYNYTDKSDIDLHIITNLEHLGVPADVLTVLFNQLKNKFNTDYEISVHGIEVEIYIEDVRTNVTSNGIYSVVFNKWIKFPKKISPTVYNIDDLLERWRSKLSYLLSQDQPDPIKNAIDNLYLIRKNSIAIDGEYGKGNQLFKELRSEGWFDKLRLRYRELKSDDLSLEQYNLEEDSRTQILNKSKSSPEGKKRFKNRLKSSVATNSAKYNNINMDKLFKNNILSVDIEVKGQTDTYTVKVSYGGFLDILYDTIKDGSEVDLRKITRSLITGFNRGDVYIHCSCLHPTTNIRLADGTTPTVEQMKMRFDAGEQLYVYSVDINGNIVWGEVEKVWITDTAQEFIKVVLSNGKQILTTDNHPYMLSDGKYVLARDLTPHTILKSMPLDGDGEYEIDVVEHVTLPDTSVYDIKVKDWHNFVVDAGVVLHNCPDFQYRYAYFATRNDINSGDPENRPSNITNPHDDMGSGCKHSLRVLSNNSWIIKVAIVIWNYIKYMKKHREKLYNDIIYPAIYRKPYEEDKSDETEEVPSPDNSSQTDNGEISPDENNNIV